MAITFSGQSPLATPATNDILGGQESASLFFWFRYESSGSTSNDQINGAGIVYGSYLSLFYTLLRSGSNSGDIDITFGFPVSGGSNVAQSSTFTSGVSYPILVVYTQGQQTIYRPGQTITMGSATGSIAPSNNSLVIGPYPPGNQCIFTVGDVNVWNGYAATKDDYFSLSQGGDPTEIGKDATSRHRWTLSGANGTTPANGDNGLEDSYTKTLNLSLLGGPGSIVYTDNLTYKASVQTSAKSRIGTSGKTLFLYFENSLTGAPVTPLSINSAPTLFINDKNFGELSTYLCDGKREFIAYLLPAQVNHGDTVKLSAPEMWCTTTAGAVQKISDDAITNRAGASAFETESLTKTLRMGMNFSTPPSYDQLYYLSKNQRYKCGYWSNASIAPDGTPTSFSGSQSSTNIENYYFVRNVIDSTNYPGQTGLRAICWDSPISSNTTFSLDTEDKSLTTITERTDLANPGDSNGNGRVRVFDIQHTPGAQSATLSVNVVCNQTDGKPNFSNLVIYGPGDFAYTDGKPAVIDRSNSQGVSAITLDRFHTGLGSARFLDSNIDYGGWSNAFEPWHIHKIEDFSWTTFSENLGPAFSQIRPYNPAVSPYVYGPAWILPSGEPFQATLARSIDYQTTTLDISDAETAPVIAGLTLSIDGELMTVKSVDGTTVTVTRGAEGTVPASHSPGVIWVQNRLAIKDMTTFSGKSNQVVELVCKSTHGLITGLPFVQYSDKGWQQFTCTNGSICYVANASSTLLVTGPKTFIAVLGSWGMTDGPVTLSQSYDLTEASAWMPLPVIGYPYEFTANVSAAWEDCWHHANVPICASDSLVHHIAQRIRDHLPAGRKVTVELSDEPWNYAFHQAQTFHMLSRISFPDGDQWSWLVHRTAQITQIFIDVFNLTGRGSEVIGLLNSQFANAGMTYELLSVMQEQKVTVPIWITTAPYINPADDAATLAIYNAADTSQVIDLWIHDLYDSQGSYTSTARAQKAAIDSYNASHGTSMRMYAYECGIETATSGNNQLQVTRDAVNHPNWWIIEQDFYAWMQTMGYIRANVYACSIGYNGNTNWGVYHGPSQPYGRGDGSDGKANNLLCLAVPGQPNTKLPSVNQDLMNVSVRGDAFLNWMRQVPPNKHLEEIPHFHTPPIPRGVSVSTVNWS